MITSAKRRIFRMIIPKYPAFNIYSRIACRTTALGPLAIATVISKIPGWDVEVIDENNYRFPGPVDESGSPDHAVLQQMRPAAVVGFYGSLSCTVPRLLELADYYRRKGVLTVGGGYHLESLPEEAIRGGVNVVVHGEGEVAIEEILAAWSADKPMDSIKGISFLRDGAVVTTEHREPMEEFESLPLPDFGLLRFAKVNVFPINRIRGCGMNCEFCAVKGRARCASPERLVAQISYLVETFHAKDFFIVDDQFAQDRNETLRFCKLLSEYQETMGTNLFLTVQIRLDCAKDNELLTAMRKCGVGCLAIGIESPIDEELKAMGKHLKSKDMVALARKYHDHGFYVHGMFIFGYPMQKGVEFHMPASERVRRYRQFFHDAKIDTIQVLLPVPLPGTELRRRLEADGRVFPNDKIGWEYYDGNFPIIVPDAPLTPESMHHGIQTLMSGYYRVLQMFGVVLHTIRFPVAMFPLVNIGKRWTKWLRHWRNSLIRTGGYFIFKKWSKDLKSGTFAEKLSESKSAVAGQQQT